MFHVLWTPTHADGAIYHIDREIVRIFKERMPLEKYSKMEHIRIQGIVTIWRLSFQVWSFYHKNKTVMKPFYLYNRNPFAGLMASLYWDSLHNLNTIITWQGFSIDKPTLV